MDLSIRVPLFYFLDMGFNRLTSAARKQNFTLFTIENSTLATDETSAFLAIENATSIAQNASSSKYIENASVFSKSEIPLFDFDYVSHLPFIKFYFLAVLLTLMLVLSSPSKNIFLVFKSSSYVVFPLIALSFIPQVFDSKMYMTASEVLLLRTIFFLILTCLTYLQMKSERRTTLTKRFILFYVIISALNPNHLEFRLAKYFLSAVLIFLSTSKIPFQTFVTDDYKSPMISFALWFGFFIVQAIPLLKFMEKYDQEIAEGDQEITADQWRKMTKMIYSTEGMVVLRVFATLLILSICTRKINVLIDAFLTIKRNYELKMHYRGMLMVSPAFFFAFVVDHEFWNCESRVYTWTLILQQIIMHALAVLSNSSDVMKSLVTVKHLKFREDNLHHRKQLHHSLSLFTFVSAILLLAISLLVFSFVNIYVDISTFTMSSQVIIIGTLASHSIAVNLNYLDALIDVFPNVKALKERSWINYVNNAEYYQKCFLFFFLAVSMLLHCVLQNFDLFVFFGGVYFASRLRDEARCNWSRCLNYEKFHFFPRRFSSRSSESLNYVCFVCDQEMRSGYVTPCEHRYHECCVTWWAMKETKCPRCRTDLAEHLGVNGQGFSTFELKCLKENA